MKEEGYSGEQRSWVMMEGAWRSIIVVDAIYWQWMMVVGASRVNWGSCFTAANDGG